MSPKGLLLAASLACTLVAGCAEDPPTGTLTDLGFNPGSPLMGKAAIDYQPFEGANPAGQAPQVGGQLQCAQGQVPGSPVPPCRGPWTDVKVNATLPKGGDGMWSVWFVNATGESKVADLTEAQAGTGTTSLFTGGANLTADHTGRYSTLELRLDGFRYATASAAEGTPDFTLATGADGVAVQNGAWSGKTLTGIISGLPENATFQGNLYVRGADGAVAADPEETFAIAGNGPFTYSSPRDIAEFAEFHIHVGHSKVNLYKAVVDPAEE